MGICGLCGRNMLSAEGCDPHKVLLNDGTVVDEPRHSAEDSLGDGNDRCHDCGADPGGIHHRSCDNARQPDGSQILIDAVAYWVPGEDVDPRHPESDYVFVVVLMPSDDPNGYPDVPTPHTIFDGWDKAEAYMDQEDWAEFEMHPMKVRSEVPEP